MFRGAEPWIVEVLREGYQIPFLSQPPMSRVPVALMAFQPGSERYLILQEEVHSLLTKEAIEEVVAPSPGFYNRLFVITEAGDQFWTFPG